MLSERLLEDIEGYLGKWKKKMESTAGFKVKGGRGLQLEGLVYTEA